MWVLDKKVIDRITVFILKFPVIDMDVTVCYKCTSILIIVVSIRSKTSLNLCSIREDGIILQKMVQLQQEKLKLMVKNYTLIILGVFRPKEGLLKTVNSMTKILVN